MKLSERIWSGEGEQSIHGCLEERKSSTRVAEHGEMDGGIPRLFITNWLRR